MGETSNIMLSLFVPEPRVAAGEKLLLAKSCCWRSLPLFLFLFTSNLSKVQSVPSLELYANWGDVICAHAYVYERDVRVSCACVCVFSNSMKKPEGHLASRFGSVA